MKYDAMNLSGAIKKNAAAMRSQVEKRLPAIQNVWAASVSIENIYVLRVWVCVELCSICV